MSVYDKTASVIDEGIPINDAAVFLFLPLTAVIYPAVRRAVYSCAAVIFQNAVSEF